MDIIKKIIKKKDKIQDNDIYCSKCESLCTNNFVDSEKKIKKTILPYQQHKIICKSCEIKFSKKNKFICTLPNLFDNNNNNIKK